MNIFQYMNACHNNTHLITDPLNLLAGVFYCPGSAAHSCHVLPQSAACPVHCSYLYCLIHLGSVLNHSTTFRQEHQQAKARLTTTTWFITHPNTHC